MQKRFLDLFVGMLVALSPGAAVAGDVELFARIEEVKMAAARERAPGSFPSMGQDINKGRRTEIDYLNGLVVDKGKELGKAEAEKTQSEQALQLPAAALSPSFAISARHRPTECAAPARSIHTVRSPIPFRRCGAIS